MRIVYIGVVDFSFHCLEIVLKNKGEVIGIVTSQSSKLNSDYCDLTPLAIKYNIPIHYSKNINDSVTIEWIREKEPDIIFCWGISQLIKSELLNMPPMGVLGVHPALLPENRGRHPLIWALVLGLKESGLTFFFMDEGADSGHILSQKKFQIDEFDDASSIYFKIKQLAENQIADFLHQLSSGQYTPKPQNHSIANYWRKRSRKDGIIDWRMNTKSILNLVRALSKPYPGAEVIYKGHSILVWKAKTYTENVQENIEPGKIIRVIDNLPVIKCQDGALMLTKYEPNTEFIEGEYME